MWIWFSCWDFFDQWNPSNSFTQFWVLRWLFLCIFRCARLWNRFLDSQIPEDLLCPTLLICFPHSFHWTLGFWILGQILRFHHLLSFRIRTRRLILPPFAKWKCICQNVCLQHFFEGKNWNISAFLETGLFHLDSPSWPEVFYLTLVQC